MFWKLGLVQGIYDSMNHFNRLGGFGNFWGRFFAHSLLDLCAQSIERVPGPAQFRN